MTSPTYIRIIGKAHISPHWINSEICREVKTAWGWYCFTKETIGWSITWQVTQADTIHIAIATYKPSSQDSGTGYKHGMTYKTLKTINLGTRLLQQAEEMMSIPPNHAVYKKK